MSHPDKEYTVVAVKVEVVGSLERTSKGHLRQGCACARRWHRGPSPVNGAAWICRGPGEVADVV